MKTWRVLFVALVLLSTSPVESQVHNDKLVTPGVGIGRWTLQMTMADLVKMNGPASSTAGRTLDSNRPYWTHEWAPLGLAAATGGREAQTVDVLVAFAPDYKTGKGVSVGSQVDAIEAAYGRPTAVTQSMSFDRRLIYDEIGLWVRVAGPTATSLGVFRPGVAKQLWKF